MAVQTADTGHHTGQDTGPPGPLRRGLKYLGDLKASVVDTGHTAPDIAQSPGLRALRRTEKALSVPLLGLIVGVYAVLGGLVVLVFGGFLYALVMA
ncbi:hypothetical protein CKO28_15245 [Rhodovibrio sodomensis]|uniref:Uncharacterized protein n=1 Tax=Rhodovibrio sodomensis TaxID=1088 RepID=A0ABS1DIQ6_9PROT|nr:hypothetical protein [Rhodovibrio sodomensis]MBK1669393.1 hypothetical protein [Rhodovibrio sodomensis]